MYELIENIMEYTIIEDCSPYYIRFKWNGLPELIQFIKSRSLKDSVLRPVPGYNHINFDVVTANEILKNLPMSGELNFMKNGVSLFSTPPHGGSRVHKDGRDHRISINLPIELHDENCITQWWADESFEGWEREFNDYSRRLITVGKKLPTPDKTMIAQPNECVLFNTDIFHSWDNTNSTNPRVILTLRVENPGSMYFRDAKKILFGNVAESGLLLQS